MMYADIFEHFARSGCLTVHFQPLSHTDYMLPVLSGYIVHSDGYNVNH